MDRLAFVPAFMPDVSGNIRTNEVAQFRAFWNSDLSFMVADSTRLDEAAAQIRSYFEREYGAEAVTLSVPREEAEATRDRNARLTAIILFLGVSGLFIAGVNVSNILLSRAMRRQRTVGILKALGASRNAIFRLFFTEALAIGVAATIVGLFVSILLARLMQSTIDIGRINPAMLAVGLGVSWVVSTVLTVFPAMQASRIPAAEAMRTE
jgi:putative ABC transport system permease protein